MVPLGVGGPPAGISFSGGLAETAGATAKIVAYHAVARERDPPVPLAVHATRKMRVVPVGLFLARGAK